MSDNPIAASYLYLLEPEIRFLEAAVCDLPNREVKIEPQITQSTQKPIPPLPALPR